MSDRPSKTFVSLGTDSTESVVFGSILNAAYSQKNPFSRQLGISHQKPCQASCFCYISNIYKEISNHIV